MSVGSDDLLIRPPGRRDRDVVVGGEYRFETAALAVGEQPEPGPQGAAHSVERVAGPAAVSEGGLLDALTAQIQLHAREGDDVERVHDGDRVRQGFGGGILVAAEPVHRHDRDPVAESLVAGLEPAPHRRGGASRDQVEQPRRPGPVDHSGEVQ